jgi:hypothetical protein
VLVRYDRHSASLYPRHERKRVQPRGAVGSGRPAASGDCLAVAGILELYVGVLTLASGVVLLLFYGRMNLNLVALPSGSWPLNGWTQ